ncbi:hypothetical protein RIF29_24859 [Crotalaria pallida]|uniref:Peptidase C19 ubiquitin carboxyl-terminal hydrolase domain-containing protein n=1 Tax=Crotalaria pallida TaxID=3830 RepID=A0AAN9EL37_CROPI
MKASKKRFRIGSQSDPVEFMSWLLNTLHADLKNSKENTSIIYECFQRLRNPNHGFVNYASVGLDSQPSFSPGTWETRLSREREGDVGMGGGREDTTVLRTTADGGGKVATATVDGAWESLCYESFCCFKTCCNCIANTLDCNCIANTLDCNCIGESDGSFKYGNYWGEADDLHAITQHFHESNRGVSAIVGHRKVVLVIVNAMNVADVSPHEFLQAVMKASKKQFRIGSQSDPVEFMSWLLNTLHADLKNSKKNTSIIYECFQGELEVVKQVPNKGITNKKESNEDKTTLRNFQMVHLLQKLPRCHF